MPSLAFYEAHYQALFAPLAALSRHGIRIDREAAKEHRETLQAECRKIQKKLERRAGESLIGKTDFSNPKIQKLLYSQLGFPRLYHEGHVTADEAAIRKCMNRALGVLEGKIEGKARFQREPQESIDICRLILRHREAAKEAGMIGEDSVDPDGRLRCRYVFGPYTGRLASRKNPYGTGVNLQNPSRKIRRLFLPDPGCVLLEVDLSQAESRAVYAQTGDPYLISLARSKPWEHDDHARTAAMIFLPGFKPKGFCPKGSLEVTKDQRQFGKKTRHAFHYDEGGARMSEDLLKESDSQIVKSPNECQAWLDRLNELEPGIPAWKAALRKELWRTGKLVSDWGREVDVTNLRFDDKLFRILYAFKGQSPIGDLLNVYGLAPLFKWIVKHSLASRINLQVHDALIVSCPWDEVWDVARYLDVMLSREREYWSPVKKKMIRLGIPAEFFVGRSWDKGSGREWNRLPEREEMEGFAKELVREMREKEAA